MSRIILHIDLNQFFVRCEEIKNPSLIGKPVMVGGDGRGGIVSTCSYKAREYGISSGMPTFQAKMLCKNLIILPCDFKYYNLMSKEFIAYTKKLTNIISQISIDECYCDITEQYQMYGNNDIIGFLTKYQNGLYNKTSLKCSIGVAPTKFLAKMGSDYKKPMGITLIRKQDAHRILFPLPVKDFYGIGKKTAPKLVKIGFKTIGDLYSAIINNNKECIDLIGSFSSDIIRLLDGKSSDVVSTQEFDPKSIGTSSTLDYDTDDKSYLKDILLKEFEKIYLQLIKEKKITKTITLTYKDAKFDSSFKTRSFSKSIKEPTDDKKVLLNETINLFDKTFNEFEIRLIGITFKNLENKNEAFVQMRFDNFLDYEEENKTFLLISDLNRQANKKIFFSGRELLKGNKK